MEPVCGLYWLTLTCKVGTCFRLWTVPFAKNIWILYYDRSHYSKLPTPEKNLIYTLTPMLLLCYQQCKEIQAIS